MDAVNGTTSNSRDSARDFAHREPLSLTWTKSVTLIVVFHSRNCRNSHCKVAPYFQLVSQQKPRQDLQYVVPPEPTTDSEESGSDTDIEMESWIKFLSVKDGRVPNQQDLLETPNNLARKSMFTHYIFDSWTLTMVKNLVMVKDLCSHTPLCFGAIWNLVAGGGMKTCATRCISWSIHWFTLLFSSNTSLCIKLDFAQGVTYIYTFALLSFLEGRNPTWSQASKSSTWDLPNVDAVQAKLCFLKTMDHAPPSCHG